MPRKAKPDKCQHRDLYIDCSPEARESGFERRNPQQRLAAATSSGRVTSRSQYATDEAVFNDPQTFPGPLVLPGEALAIDPEDSPQSFKSWHQTVNHYGIRVSEGRNTLYVIPPPEVTDEVKNLMAGWVDPVVPRGEKTPGVPKDLDSPGVDDLCDYLGAFYHAMEIRKFEPGFRFISWDSDAKSNPEKSEQRIGLATPGPAPEVVGVKYRPSIDGIAKGQLNLNDILDAMIPRVPPDAHAIVMMVDQDLYEDEDDDFCCGRAYGGSRVCVVATFRYHPCLDRYAGISLEHSWPASHCRSYADELCDVSQPPAKKAKGTGSPIVRRDNSTPMGAAVEAANGKMVPRTKMDCYGLWFGRAARTISHEIGHCVTLDHCVYFACVMQGTAGMAEDMRQAPYCCPVCIEKLSNNLCVLQGHGGPSIDTQRAWIRGQHRAMLEFCRNWSHVGMFAGLAAWLEKRLDAMGGLECDGETVSLDEQADNTTAATAEPQRLTKGTASSKLFAQWLGEE